jgi:hypothetical protein
LIPFGAVAKTMPQQNEVIESTDDQNSEVTLRWKDLSEPERYQVNVFDSEGRLVLSKETKEASLLTKLPAGARYTWTVRALNALEQSRAPASLTDVKDPQQGGFSINDYIKLELARQEEPSQLYSWAKLGLAQGHYVYENWDNQNQVDQKLMTSSAEGALGYWHRKTNIGLLATASLYDVKMKSSNNTFARMSLLGGYRYKFKDSPVRARVWLGASYEQVPEVVVASPDTPYAFKNLNSIGPEMRLFYLNSIGGDWGYHLYARGYLGLIDRGTPNQLKMKDTKTMTLGVYATRAVSPGWIAMAGYAYEMQSASYQSIDTSGNANKISTTGHYFSIQMLFGLEPASK